MSANKYIFLLLIGIARTSGNALLTPNITFIPNNPTFWTVPFIDPNTEACGVEYSTSIKPKGSQPLSVMDFDTSLCNSLYDKGEAYEAGMMYRQSYDTLRRYIELCAMQQYSYGEFNTISAALDFMDTNRLRYIDGRAWYKKVLYYNPDTNFYCADVNGILFTFQYFEGRGLDQLGALAVIKYLRDTHRCLSWYFEKTYDTIYKNTLDNVVSTWRDSVKDSLKTPLDTTLPSIDELGLGILRGQNGVTTASPVSNVSAIGSVSLVQNPFHNEAILRYRLSHGALVRVDIYDALGRLMSGEGEGYHNNGEYRVNFDSHTWPSGTYYVRISTMSGETQTVKAIKK